MKYIRNYSTEPYFNLAAEEYLLDGDESNIFMLWQNSPAVIIGRNQNTYSEVNAAFAADNNIKVVRRLTGGGAVYHDLGNVNFTFITDESGGGVLDFARFCRPIIETLNSLGAKAELSGRNDIIIEGKKVSGNAQCVRNKKIIHHGTLLFCSDLTVVGSVLSVNRKKLESKGIKSVASRVANINDYINYQLSVNEFIDYIYNYIGGELSLFSNSQKNEIQALADTKYSTWEWNWGQSKKFEGTADGRFDWGGIEIGYTLEGGFIKDIKICGDFFGIGVITEYEKSFIGCKFTPDGLKEPLLTVNNYITGAKAKDISDILFI